MASTGTRTHDDDVPVAMQFDEPGQQRTAATFGMWIFLATEVLFFGGMILGYIVYHYQFPQAFSAGSHHLNMWYGGAMTAILLTGSLLVALSDHRIEGPGDARGKSLSVFRMLFVTALLGIAFLSIEFYEYYEVIKEGLFPGAGFKTSHFTDKNVAGHSAQMFYVLYFCMTGLHAIHMIIGISLVGGLAFFVRYSSHPSSLQNTVTVIGLYWHFVDIIWVFLYPLFYLVPELH